MSFWQSELGEISGKAEDAFTRMFKIIPDGTMALARIEKFSLVNANDKQFYNINWVLTGGDYKGANVFQKIHAFDSDPKKRHKALNMLKYIYDMFHVKPSSANAPQDADLMVFKGKFAGIKIQEWSNIAPDGRLMEGNFVSEVHEAQGFKCETGVKLDAQPMQSGVDSAFSRNPKGSQPVEDDIPF